MGVIPPKAGFLEGLRDICDRYGSLLILDEVMTGFRVHPGGAQALYGVNPDLTTLGKVIGGGLPVGAYGGKKEIMEKIAPAGPVYQAGTLSGNPLAVAAGLKTLEIISEPGFHDELNAKDNGFFESCQALIEQKNLPLTLNHVNSMGCLFFNSNPVVTFSDAFKSDTSLFSNYFAALLNSGVYIAPSQYEAMFISSAHRDDDLNSTLAVMENALVELFA